MSARLWPRFWMPTAFTLTVKTFNTEVIRCINNYLSREQVDDLKAVLDNPDGHQLLAIVASVHHEGVDQPLDDGALGLAETLGSVTSCETNKIKIK